MYKESEIAKQVAKQIEGEDIFERVSPIWPEMGTKEWFIHYAGYIADFAKHQMQADKAHQIHSNLSKFDPKFAELCKKAHDSAIEFMNYAASRVENK